jgi:hypothetical protein
MVHLSGHSLSDVARLGALPVAGAELLIEILCEIIDRLVDSAHRSVCEDRINAFDQMRINSFLQRPRAADKPLMVKLQKSTYKRYSSIWKRLLCFEHRTMQPSQRVQLQHRLTSTQITHYDRMMTSAEMILHDNLGGSDAFVSAELSMLDHSCLQFCASLLDHDLKGSIFESSILGFLAVLGIDEVMGVLREAYHYTPMLSGFIKISQLFVIQLAVHEAEADIGVPRAVRSKRSSVVSFAKTCADHYVAVQRPVTISATYTRKRAMSRLAILVPWRSKRRARRSPRALYSLS